MDRNKLLYRLEKLQFENEKITSNMLKDITVKDNKVTISLSSSNPSLQFKNRIKSVITDNIKEAFPQALVTINFIATSSSGDVKDSGIKNIIAIASGKGGVGKSTVASNLAISLKNHGYSVGLIDADIYGPSIPLMFDAENERPKAVNKNNRSFMGPVVSYGVKIMSIGFFSNPNDAIIFRGPMATKALNEMITNTYWGELDYLLIDLPPGTGDVHLSIVQTLSLTGAVIITTPQPVSLIDARKAINMFKKKEINVPVIGLIENMSFLLIDNKKHYIFGKDGGQSLSDTENIPFLGQIPLEQTVREAGDVGRPAALQKSSISDIFSQLAQKVGSNTIKRNNELPPTKKVEITHNKGCN